MVETIADRLTDAWARTDRIFELLAPGQLARPADRAAPPVHLLPGAPAGLRLEPRVRRRARAAPVQRRPSTSCSRAASTPTWTIRRHCHDHPEVPDRWPAVAEVRRLSRSRARGRCSASVDAVAGARGDAPDGPGGPRLQHGDRARAHASGDAAVHAAAAAARAQGATGLAAALRARARPPRRPRSRSRRARRRSAPASTSCPSAGTTSSPPSRSTCPPSPWTPPR